MSNVSSETTTHFINKTLVTTLSELNVSETTGQYLPTDGSKLAGKCYIWEDAQHTVFQLANLCMAISFLTPSSFRYHVFFLRCLLLGSFVFFVSWAGLFVCMLDSLIWYSVFIIVDVVHIVYLTYTNLPAKMSNQMEEMYVKLFQPLRLARKDFSLMCNVGSVTVLHKGNLYAVEGITPIGEKVSILLKGKLKVMYGKYFLHDIQANEFVDSPECDAAIPGVESEERYQVTIISAEESTILTWSYNQLQEHLGTDPFLATLFHYVLGKDISHKLYQIQEQLLANPDYMRTLASRQSSMVNLRNSLVTQDSCLSLSKLNSVHTAGGLAVPSSTRSSLPKKSERQDTVETSV